jgi:hypothetical protein
MPLQVQPYERLKSEYAAGEIVHCIHQGKHIAAILTAPVDANGNAELMLIIPGFGMVMRQSVPYNWADKPEGNWHFRE